MMNDKPRKRIKRALLGLLLLLLLATVVIWAVFASRKTSGNGTVVVTPPPPEQTPTKEPTPDQPDNINREYRPLYYPKQTPSPRRVVKDRCPLSAPSLEVLKEVEKNIAAIRKNAPMMRPAGSVTIPVYFHILTNADGTKGRVTDEQVKRQIDVLNTAFAGNGPDGTGALTTGTPTPFKFELKGIDRTPNEEWFTMTYSDDPVQAELDAKAELNRGDESALNIYTIKLTSKPYGWARWPWDLAEGVDGIVIGYTTLPGGNEYLFNKGDTATHEVGHWLGLFHTYEGSACTGIGDYVADTPPELSGAQLCPTGRDTCQPPSGEPDSIRNFMNSTHDACMYKFSPLQADRMDAIHLQYRPSS